MDRLTNKQRIEKMYEEQKQRKIELWQNVHKFGPAYYAMVMDDIRWWNEKIRYAEENWDLDE
jgi:hypothetical protein